MKKNSIDVCFVSVATCHRTLSGVTVDFGHKILAYCPVTTV